MISAAATQGLDALLLEMFDAVEAEREAEEAAEAEAKKREEERKR